MVDILKIKALLSLDEGVRLYPYTDTRGKLTIGVGHNLSDDGISTSVCNLLFVEDLTNAQVVLQTCLPSWQTLDEVRQAVMLDLAFNLSHTLFGFKTFLAYMTDHNFDGAASDLATTAWYSEVGQRGPRLVTMVQTGLWPHGFAAV